MPWLKNTHWIKQFLKTKEMAKINRQAWSILSPDEADALTLQFTMEKSSWQAGEILEKSHYKYLEIKYRAEQYLKMFTHHFNLYPELFPQELNMPKQMKMYLELCILKRKKTFEAVNITKETFEKTSRNEIFAQIENTFKNWRDTDSAYTKHFLNICKEFDRWNNFRILPNSEREPSAFKRRLKKMYKKHINVLVELPFMSIKKIEKAFRNKKSNIFWPHLRDQKAHITPIDESAIKHLTPLSLYVFDDFNVAKEYISIIMPYLLKPNKDCRDGLDFWPKYRELIKKAINYEEIQNVTPERKWLKIATNKLEFT